MKAIIDYIIQFLLYGNKDVAKQVGYTADEAEWQNYRVVIVPNGHLGKEIVMPDLETSETESILELNFIIGKIKHTVKRIRKNSNNEP